MLLGLDAGGDQGADHGRHRVRAVGNEDRVRVLRRLRHDVRLRGQLRCRAELIALQRHDARALARGDLLERRLDHRAVGILRQHRRERALAVGDREIDDAVDVGLRQEAEQIDAARRDAHVGRECDHRHAAGARHLADRLNRLREQRPDDDLGAFAQRLLRRLRRAAGRAGVVLHQKLDVGAVELGERHLGGVLHRQRGDAGVAAGRQRQDQRDLDLAGADRGGRLDRAAGLRAEQIRRGAAGQQRRQAPEHNAAPSARKARCRPFGLEPPDHAFLGATSRRAAPPAGPDTRRMVNQMERITNSSTP